MRRYEYRFLESTQVDYVAGTAAFPHLSDLLNEAGRDGWHIVHAETDVAHDHFYIILERETDG